jgi:hypothetical protein
VRAHIAYGSSPGLEMAAISASVADAHSAEHAHLLGVGYYWLRATQPQCNEHFYDEEELASLLLMWQVMSMLAHGTGPQTKLT